jgi:hypothetical protein
MFIPILLAMKFGLFAQAPPMQEQQSAYTSSQSSGLNPLPVSRTQLAAASKAQTIPNSKTLDNAWAYYQKWQGAWRPNHVKPTASEKQDVLDFTSTLLAQLDSLAASEKLGKQSVDGERLKKMVVVGSPEFREALQSTGTQTLKSLLLMGFAQHELDFPDGVKIAQPLLIKLLARTPLDPDLYLLYARLSIDAQQKQAAWHAARTGIFMRPDPSDNDLEFVAFIGSQAAKDQWPTIQVMLKEVAIDNGQAERVIKKATPLFTGNMKSTFTPLGGNSQVP